MSYKLSILSKAFLCWKILGPANKEVALKIKIKIYWIFFEGLKKADKYVQCVKLWDEYME